MSLERRDPKNRAETLRRVTLWISRITAPVSHVPSSIAAPDAGLRILKRLALRLLVRYEECGWLPQPALLMPLALTEDV